jgi:ferredoxin
VLAVALSLAFLLRTTQIWETALLFNTVAALYLFRRPARLRITARAEACDGCRACTSACPMDVDVAARALALTFGSPQPA